jgi:hypothetical protein
LNLYEIINGVPLYKLSGITAAEIVKTLWYLIWGLYTAQYHFKFVHFDLHADNVLISKLSSPVTCEHVFGGNRISFSTSYIPRVIDYGKSSLMVNNIFIGPMEEIVSVPNESIEDFALDPKRYFLGTFDIARYIRDICTDLYGSKSRKDLSKFIFDTFYTFFLERATEVVLPDDQLLDVFKSRDFEMFMKKTEYTHDSNIHTIPQIAAAYNLYTEPIEVYMEWLYPRVKEYLV